MESGSVLTGMEMWINEVLLWIGFGTVVGLLARLLMPGKDPAGAVATLAIGIGGVIFGCGGLALILEEKIRPVSPAGLFVATAGAFAILGFHRLMSGRLDPSADTAKPRTYRKPRRPYTLEG
jgi:uncharacterized membrane protein YeaQ/YmgE (transglycosylase-associated protein family)